MFLELAAVLVPTLLIIYYIFYEFPSGNLPPGPRPWPVIGNINLLSKDIHLSLTELGEQYGKIFRVFIGHNPVVVLSGDAIREALVRQPREFAGRPNIAPQGIAETTGLGVPIMDYGPRWKLFRKLGHSAIKVYGEDRLQKTILREIDELCNRLKTKEGKSIDIIKQFGIAVTNIICTKIVGTRYEIDDPEFKLLFEIHDRLTRVPTVRVSTRDLLPFLRYILPRSSEDKELARLSAVRYKLLREKYQQHVAAFDPENIRDYTDALLKAKQEAEEEDKSAKEHLQEKYIIMGGLATLFIAGSETITTTLSWAVIYLLHNPEIQDRLHNEIIERIGRDEVPMLSQRKGLPLLEAFTAETLRMANLLPVSIPHKTTKDTILLGYHIPEGTTVMTNTWALHHDPSLWTDPFQFSIERFLDEEGNFQSPPGGTFLPFGAGPRVCLGEVLARSELFLFLSRLMQQFKFVNPPGSELPSVAGETGLVLHPRAFTVCVTCRD